MARTASLLEQAELELVRRVVTARHEKDRDIAERAAWILKRIIDGDTPQYVAGVMLDLAAVLNDAENPPSKSDIVHAAFPDAVDVPLVRD